MSARAAEVKFGLSLPNRAVLFGVLPDTLLESAVLAEESGLFDSVWVGDNLTSRPRLEAIVTLSALAARTSRLELGTICLASFPMRDPLTLALQWASLDQVSGGRTILAVCNGFPGSAGPQYAAELAALGVRSTERVARVEEGIELLRAFWGQGPVTHHGAFYDYEGIDLVPKPARRVPIVLAVNPEQASAEVVERALRRVARLADGWQSDGTPAEVFRERWEQIRTYADEYGRADQVTDSSLHVMVNIDDDPARGRAAAMEFLDRYYGPGLFTEEKLDAWLATGPPEAVIEHVLAFVDAGCTTPVLRFVSFDQRGQLERALADVLPVLRREVGREPIGA
jgi:alkanesulfonate monooxygenase SsuD/methylene tetrahydromethanopterin reductase-like flavin-dependent oxidoreductase (luciferase family)